MDYAIGVVAVLVGDRCTIRNPAFLSLINVANMLSQWAPAGLMAIGMTYVIIAGGFDLSIAAVFSLCAVVAGAVAQDQPVWLAFLAAMLPAAAVGFANAGPDRPLQYQSLHHHRRHRFHRHRRHLTS